MTLPEIESVVCGHLKVSLEYINQKTKFRPVVEKRQIAHYFAKQETKESLQDIGTYFGMVDHATVIHSVKTINNLIKTDPKIKQIVSRISDLINPDLINRKKRHSRRLVARLKFMCNPDIIKSKRLTIKNINYEKTKSNLYLWFNKIRRFTRN